MSDEFPELPKRNSAAPAGPFVLVNVEELEAAIYELYSRDMDELNRLLAERRRANNKSEASYIDGQSMGYSKMRAHAIAAIRRAAGGGR